MELNPRSHPPQSSRWMNLLRIPSSAFAAVLVSAPLAWAADFAEQRASVSAAVETQPESAILSLLEAGIAENQPAQATALADQWLRQNLPKNPKLFYYAGRSAELSGDWSGAAALYQQFLKQADVKSPEAGDAVTAVHSLLIDRLADTASAYAFGTSEARRLAPIPQFRQYDRWFLNTAQSRNDRGAVASRLLGTVKAGLSTDHLISLYEGDFMWLLNSIRGARLDLAQDRFSADFVTEVKELSKGLTYDEELRLFLDWSVSVRAYNMARIDGKNAAAPLAESKALLDKFPGYAQRVQTDWAGGSNGPHYRDDPPKYWPDQVEEKMAQIKAVIPRLTPLDQMELIATWGSGYYQGGPEILTIEQARQLIIEKPDWVNRKSGPVFRLAWNTLSPEDARKLAPLLDQNPSPEASLVRAIVAAGEEKNLDKAMAALLGPELWRLGPGELNGPYPDQLWHWAGRPGDNLKRDQEIAKTRAIAAEITRTQVTKDTPAPQRLAEFRRLWNDAKSRQSTIPSALSRIPAILSNTPEAVIELLRDPSPEAQRMVRNALALGISDDKGPLTRDPAVNGLSPDQYSPLIPRLMARHGNMQRLTDLGMYAPYPLLPNLQNAVAEQLKKNELQPWLVMTWINAQFPENNEASEKLMTALFASPGWTALPPEARFGARSWFQSLAMTDEQLAITLSADGEVVCDPLISLLDGPDGAAPEPLADPPRKNKKKKRNPKVELAIVQPGLEKTAAALQATLDGLRKSPVRLPIQGLDQLAKVDPEVIKDPEMVALLVELADSLRSFDSDPTVANHLLGSVSEKRDPAMLLQTAPYLWRNVELFHHPLEPTMALAESLLETQPEAASALARCGLNTIARHRGGHTWFKNETHLPRLKAVRGKAAMPLGLIQIPVAPNDPSYPVYQSQAEWVTDNQDSAGKLLDANWEQFVEVHRELSISYLMWVLQRTIYAREEQRQETLITLLLGWADEAGTPLTLEEQARIQIAYGDIAMQRGQLRQAHEIFTRTQKKETYQGLMVRHEAALRKAQAERAARDFDGALQTLAELELERVPEIWTGIRYARAEVHYDMEEFDDAKDDIESILAREPNHPDSKILLGKIQLKRQKLMEATEVELGSSTSQDSLVPGEKLKITLSDPTLAVSGAGTEIEVVVWTTTGDREVFFLRQFGDQKTKFRGEVETALGEPVIDDGTLQVIGDDEVFYAYSEKFREKMNGLDERRGGPITVASDALLMTSARKLLTEAEQRQADMEAVMAAIQKKPGSNAESAAKAELASRALDPKVRAQAGETNAEKMERYVVNVAKPGNPIHVRVIDPDRSRTPEIDELIVSVASSSGDSISQVTLRETGTHSGWFEGSIPTTNATALAFAENSEPGRNPNMVISQNKDYPAWRPTAGQDTPPVFTVDLNDNVALGEMVIEARESGAGLKKFIVQTAMNRTDWTTVAVYPPNLPTIEKPWHPAVVVMNDTDHHHNRNERSVYDLSELHEHVERGWITQTYAAGASGNVSGPSEAMTETIPGQVKWLRQGQHHNSHVVYRFRGYFHEPSDVVRRFKVELGNFQIPPQTHPSVSNPPQFLLAVNGRPITDPKLPDRLEGEINLRPGIHYFEIWATGWDCTIGFGRTVKLLANLGDPETLVDCPDEFFNPATFPANSMDHRNGPAELKADESGDSFTVKFGSGSRARLLRLLLIDQEGPVPTLNKISLKNADGGAVLPLADDFAELNKNDTLEILTGDRISVRYRDDRFVTESKQRLERFLDVSFTDARVEFADMEPRWSERSNDFEPYYERLLRFPHDKPLTLAVHDADMDVSVEPDTVQVTLNSDTGGSRQFVATETGDSTGIFKLVITPVTGEAKGDDQLQVEIGGSLTAGYVDQENNRPGVPTERVASIQHAKFVEPEFVLAHSEVSPWVPEEGDTGMRTLIHGFEPMIDRNPDRDRTLHEMVKVRWQMDQKMLPAGKPPEGGFETVHGQYLRLEIVAPQYALGIGSTGTVYAQTDSGRRAAGAAPDGGFDISVPGTIEVKGGLFGAPAGQTAGDGVPTLAIYAPTGGWNFRDEPPMDRFFVTVPLVAGLLPDYGVLSEEEREARAELAADSRLAELQMRLESRGLVVKAGERVHLGFRYTDPDGNEKWATASIKVMTHPAFDLMAEDYRSPMTAAYAGEDLNLRVVDLGADLTDEIDTVSVLVQAKSGAQANVELRESGPHSGIFKSSYQLSYAEKPGALAADYDVRANGFPIVYGDSLAARYTDANGVKTDTHFVTISKGADGTVAPFSKIYEDETIAMRTQFSLAEAYLEMAKRHRKLGETKRAELEYASAKLLLSKAMDQFTDPETRANAEYLLGTLTMEEAIATEDDETRETRFRAALSRFMIVTGSYPQTLYASKAQYQIATVYEALKEPDIAAQEYVKLAYKYPDSEFLATSMARLGTHFLKKAAEYEEKAKPLLAKAESGEDKDAAFEGQAMQKMAVAEYLKTASIFSRLQERFPGNELSGPAGLRAGQAYMRAGDHRQAIEAFEKVAEEQAYDGPKIRAEAIYWTGMSYLAIRQEMAAYSCFKRLTYDFPESTWASYARAQLSQDRLLQLEERLELERLESAE